MRIRRPDALHDCDSLLTEKLQLLLKIRENPTVLWSGRHRAPLTRQGVYRHPLQTTLPMWLGVGGTPELFIRPGTANPEHLPFTA